MAWTLFELRPETYFMEKGDKAYQATKRGDSPTGATQKDWLFGQRRVKRGRHRPVRRLRLLFLW